MKLLIDDKSCKSTKESANTLSAVGPTASSYWSYMDKKPITTKSQRGVYASVVVNEVGGIVGSTREKDNASVVSLDKSYNHSSLIGVPLRNFNTTMAKDGMKQALSRNNVLNKSS